MGPITIKNRRNTIENDKNQKMQLPQLQIEPCINMINEPGSAAKRLFNYFLNLKYQRHFSKIKL